MAMEMRLAVTAPQTGATFRRGCNECCCQAVGALCAVVALASDESVSGAILVMDAWDGVAAYSRPKRVISEKEADMPSYARKNYRKKE